MPVAAWTWRYDAGGTGGLAGRLRPSRSPMPMSIPQLLLRPAPRLAGRDSPPARPHAPHRPDRLRLRCELLPPDPEGRRPRADRRRGRAPSSASPARRSPDDLPRGRDVASPARPSRTASSSRSRATGGRVKVEDGGTRFRAQPGVIGASVNDGPPAATASKMGPDPASINTCTMGGILSNNSSGMCCGVTQNAYHTLESLTFLLPSGTRSTRPRPTPTSSFRAAEPALWQGMLDLKARLEADPALAARIRSKYRMKNTTGYSLNAFLDFDRPVEIFRHLLVGAEGTLAFISEAVLRHGAGPPGEVHRASSSSRRCTPPARRSSRCATRARRRSSSSTAPPCGRSRRQPGVPPSIRSRPRRRRRRSSSSSRRRRSPSGRGSRTSRPTVVAPLALLEPARFTHDATEQALLWKMRQGTVPLGRRGAQERHDGDHRGRRLPGRAPRRRRGRPDAALRQARLPRGDHLRPRQGREPPLRHHAVLQRPGGRRPVRALHRRRRRARREELRRRAEGRARHGPQHGAVRGDRVGARGLRRHEAAEGALSTRTGS